MSIKPPPPCPPPRPDLEDESPVPASKPSRKGPPPIPLRPDLGEGVDDHASSNVQIPKIPPPTLPKKPSFKRSQGKPEITIISSQPLAPSGAFSPFVPTTSPTDKPALPNEGVLPHCEPSEDLTPSESLSRPVAFGVNPGQDVSPTSIVHEEVSSPPISDAIPRPTPKPIPGQVSTAPKLAPYSSKHGMHAVPSPQNNAAFSSFGSESSVPSTSAQNQPAFSPFGDDFSTTAINTSPGSDPFAMPPQPLVLSPQRAGAAAPQPLKPPPKAPAPGMALAQPLRPAPPGLPFPSALDPTLQPSRPAPPGPPVQTVLDTTVQPSRPEPPGPPVQTASDSPVQYSRPAPPMPTNVSPLRVSTKANKPREPPQRPKSKPVCEPSLTNDPFQMGLASNEAGSLADPIAPKRKKNKTSKEASEEPAAPQGSGINNSAFQDYEPVDNRMKMDGDVEMKKEEVNPATSKKSKFPTVIRTKPNGKEAPKSDSSSSNLEDLKDIQFDSTKVKYTKPTVIKSTTRSKPPPPPPSKKAAQEPTPGNTEQSTSISQSEPELQQQTKSKPKPTIIIPKAKKDETKKTEVVTSPGETTKPDTETKKDPVEKVKPKRIPSIIRPNRAKKDKNQTANSTENSRGIPEGQSQESSSKIVPSRKAPPRPSPPKPGPPRPGPPKRAANAPAQSRTQPVGNVTTEDAHSESTHKGRATPRPATIGRDIDADHHKGVKQHKKKKEETTAVSSVVTTKIEPSCIALYDYDSGNVDDLSFKAGDEIFLVKRINHDWYIGRLDESEGMIPLKFVEIIEDLPPEAEPSESKVANKSSSFTTVALYDFEGQSHDELTFHAGDTILLTEMINDEWLRGTSNGDTGMFPLNFVDFTHDMKQKLRELKQNDKHQDSENEITLNEVTSGPRCRALYDYHTGNDGDLRFNQDDVIKLVERINDEWLKGEVHGLVGMFPAAYVDIIEDLTVSPSAPAAQESSGLQMVKAIHDYISDADGDLSFKQGDMITIVKRINDEWLEGELYGHTGMFPAAFVETDGQSTLQVTHKPQADLLPKGIALYDFTGETDHELTFKAGDEIILLQKINEEWMEGEFNGHIGHFPSAFIEVLIPLP